MPYNYHDSAVRRSRLPKDLDRCGSDDGPVSDLASLLVGGRLRDPRDRRRLLTTTGQIFIYAVGLDSSIRIAEDGDRSQPGSVKHETLYHNADVLAAGEIVIEEGEVVSVNDLSGSYGTRGELRSTAFAAAVVGALTLHAIPRRSLGSLLGLL